MATNKTLSQVTPYIESLQDWLTASAKAYEGEARPWCTLSLEDLSEDALATYFYRDDLGESYATEYAKSTDAGQPFAFLQRESDLIFGLHRCFAARHRGRLMMYRDAAEQQGARTFNLLSLGAAKFAQEKELAEQLVANNNAAST